MIKRFVVLLLLMCPITATATVTDVVEPTGIMAIDFAIPTAPPEPSLPLFPAGDSVTVTPGAKSVWLAGGLSLLVPGSGQLYAGAPWWRTALYAAIEAASWTGYFIYNAKGDDGTKAFEQFADTHWDVTRYIDWIAANYTGWPDEDVDKRTAAEALAAIYRSNDPLLKPWERVNFEQLRKLERAVKGGFSHTLPDHGEQQYYEEIGKYVQYRSGWDDHLADGDTIIYAPSRVSARNHQYTAMRSDANGYYGIAQTAVVVIILNHIASMIDAAFTANHFNARLRTDFHGMMLPDGNIVPRGSLTFSVGL